MLLSVGSPVLAENYKYVNIGGEKSTQSPPATVSISPVMNPAPGENK